MTWKDTYIDMDTDRDTDRDAGIDRDTYIENDPLNVKILSKFRSSLAGYQTP
jgi:hypothetical protein